jgi:electron transfer flavoprotein beta subunit
MRVLVCVKRVPATGGRIVLTPDGADIDVRYLGFTVSPHEECAVEEAVRIVEAHGGSSTVLTLGPAAAEDQLREAMAIGVDRAILLETDGRDWDPIATAGAIIESIRAQEAADGPFDLILFGNESADSGGFQVGIRVAADLDRPCVTGVKALKSGDGRIVARREAASGGWESFDVGAPAVVAVKEGINLPRYPSIPGRLRAKKKEIERSAPEWRAGGLEKIVLRLPKAETTAAEVIGRGPEAAPAIVDLLTRIGVLDG